MSNSFENDEVIGVYQAIAYEIMAFIGERPWDEAGAEYEIYSSMVKCSWWVRNKGKVEYAGCDIPDEIANAVSNGIFMLRQHIIDHTGDRIWGINFTLFPSGKFNIEYNYNKPDDYEESDETISGDEINDSFIVTR